MKRWGSIFICIIVMEIISSCGNKHMDRMNTSKGKQKLIIGATPVPHAEILQYIKPKLETKGIELEIRPITNDMQPNRQVHEKQWDANFFQQKVCMDHAVTTKGYYLVNVASVHMEPFGEYSKKVKSIDEVAEGATVAITNDATNKGRALLLLEKQGLIKLRAGHQIAVTIDDIVSNPKNLHFKEFEAPMFSRMLDEVELVLVGIKYALQAGLDPITDALFMEDATSPYVNILATRPDNEHSEAMQKLILTLQKEDVKTFIDKKYKGAIVPVF